MSKRSKPTITYEYDASIKALRVWVALDGHPAEVELRLFDAGHFTLHIYGLYGKERREEKGVKRHELRSNEGG